MKEQISQWFEQSAPFEGILACGVRQPDHSTMTKSWSDSYSELAMENALRCVADLFQVLPLNRLPQGRVRWVYENALLHCERRSDGACLGIFTLREEARCDAAGLERVFAEFQALAQGSAP
jgi:hypothetical protein